MFSKDEIKQRVILTNDRNSLHLAVTRLGVVSVELRCVRIIPENKDSCENF